MQNFESQASENFLIEPYMFLRILLTILLQQAIT